MPQINLTMTEERTGCGYPPPYDQPCLHRSRKALGDEAGLTQFGVNLLRLKPGAWSSQRHWHGNEDEFVYVITGEVALVDDGGVHLLRAGDCACFKAGVANGHHLQNQSDAEALVLEVGSRAAFDPVCYPDIDLQLTGDTDSYSHRDGTTYPPK